MKKLLFCRSYKGSFSFTTEKNSLFYSSSFQGKVILPITLELAFSHPLNPDTGMSASLPEMNSLWAQFQQLHIDKLFKDLLDFYKIAKIFFSIRSADFHELRIGLLEWELGEQHPVWQLSYKASQFLNFSEVATEIFYSPVELVFVFNKEADVKYFLEQEFLELKEKLKDSFLLKNPFSVSNYLEKIRFSDPKTGNKCELEKPF